MERNPNHKVLQQARGNYHAILACMMVKLGLKEIELTMEDVERVSHGNVNVVLDATKEASGGGLVLKIVDDKTAMALARREGGRVIDS